VASELILADALPFFKCPLRRVEAIRLGRWLVVNDQVGGQFLLQPLNHQAKEKSGAAAGSRRMSLGLVDRSLANPCECVPDFCNRMEPIPFVHF
jgi:hypothetical protein